MVATTCMVPMLMFYTGFLSMVGAFINVHYNEMTSFTTFMEKAFEKISFHDIFTATFKSFVYGFTIGMVGCFKGYNAAQGTEGVGRAANSTVVVSMFLIFIEEMLIVQLSNTIQ